MSSVCKFLQLQTEVVEKVAQKKKKKKLQSIIDCDYIKDRFNFVSDR